MLNNWSFKNRLILFWAALQFFITGLTAVFLINSATDSLKKDIIYQSEQIQPVINSALATPLIQRDYATVTAILKEVTRSQSIERISIQDASGRVIAQEPPSSQKNQDAIKPFLLSFVIEADGINLGRADIDISRERLISTRNTILLTTLLISLASFGIFLGFTVLIGRLVTKPITDLAEIAKEITKGNFNLPVLKPRQDEVGQLQQAFESLFTEIEMKIDELHSLNSELEDKVQSRTAELQAARDELVIRLEKLKLLATVVDKSNFAISIIDLQSPGNPVIYINNAFTDITGYTASDVIGKTGRIFNDGIDDAASANQIRIALEKKSECTIEFLDTRNNGDTYWNRLTLFPVTTDDAGPRYYVVFQSDISALKKATGERETLLLEVQENQRLKSLGILVAGLAHEINNPLGVALTATTHVSQSARSLRSGLENLQSSDIRDFLEDEEIAFQLIFENLHRASELVRGFKDISIDRSLDEKKEIHLQTFIDTLGQSLTPVLRKARCAFSVHIDPAISLKVNTGSLGQLVTNLVLNATIHAFEGIHNSQIKIEGYQNDSHIILKIIDNGNGIPVNVLPNLFTPFFTINRINGGTGLGLYVSRQIATEILGGTLNVENRSDGGCEFTLTISK